MRVCIQTTGIAKPAALPISSLGHQAHGWGKPQTTAFLSFHFMPFWACVVSFVCVCMWHLFVGWLAGWFGQSHLEAGGCCPSLCQGTACLPCPASAPLASRQVWGDGWRFCWPSSQNTKFQWAPGKQGEGHLEAGVRQESTNLSSSPQGRGKCLSQRRPLRVKRLRLVKISETGNTLLSLPVNTSFWIKVTRALMEGRGKWSLGS